MNTNMEKLYFAHVMQNPDQFSKVEPFFFKNADIQFVYDIIRSEYLRNPSRVVPSPKQILAMVQLNDPEGKITKNILKILLTETTEEVDVEGWLLPRFKAWKVTNSAWDKLNRSIDRARSMRELDHEQAMEVAMELKNAFNDISILDDEGEDVGSDFDDPEAHIQDIGRNCISTGWANMDVILGGGWDRATLAVIIGETSCGKSMWMQNISANLADRGANVAYLTLEMAAHKVMKRLGCMRLKINPKDYDTRSRDHAFMKSRINGLRAATGTPDLFNSKPGKIFVKKFNTSDCTVTDIDNYIKKVQEIKKVKLDVVIVDYINIMSIEKGANADTLYLKGKHLAEGLRRLADRHDCTIVTATQVVKDVWGASDISIQDIPESKAIAESADTVWGIIRNPPMKKANKYQLKILKLRDGEHHEERVGFDFNPDYLTMENDTMIGTK